MLIEVNWSPTICRQFGPGTLVYGILVHGMFVLPVEHSCSTFCSWNFCPQRFVTGTFVKYSSPKFCQRNIRQSAPAIFVPGIHNICLWRISFRSFVPGTFSPIICLICLSFSECFPKIFYYPGFQCKIYF